MSLKEQLKKLATPVSSAYSTDTVRRKSLVYDNPKSVDGHSCFHDCAKAFSKLCEVDFELKRFKSTLFSTDTVKLELTNLLPLHKTKIDEQISLFLFMINTHVRSIETMWALEWLVFKFNVHINYVEDFMMLILPHHETGFFAKSIQLLDFRQSASQWQWLKPFAVRGVPLSRVDFLKACRSQPSLIPFVGSFVSTYAKFEKALSLNRIQLVGSFFVSTIVGLCDSGISDAKLANVIRSLQGTIRKGLRSPNLPPFQSACSLAIVRVSLSTKLNHELILDWIECLLKKIRNGSEWESLRIINILMRTQEIPILPRSISGLYEILLNSLSPLERALLEKEENKNICSLNLSSSSILEESVHVQNSIAIPNINTDSSAISVAPLSKRRSKLTVKQVSKMTYEDLFSNEPESLKTFETVHAMLGARDICVMRKFREKCSCPTLSMSEAGSDWILSFLISIMRFDQLGEQEMEESDAEALFKVFRAKAALQIVAYAFETILPSFSQSRHSPRTLSKSLQSVEAKQILHSIDEAFPCILTALLYPFGDVRVEAYSLVQRCVDIFGKVPPTSDFYQTREFIADLQPNSGTFSDSIKQMLQGDSLSALILASSDFVRAVFRMFCRQSLIDNDLSRMCWFAAAQLLHTNLLPSIIDIGSRLTYDENNTSQLIGWPALLQIIRYPHLTKSHVAHNTCLNRLDSLTLQCLLSIPSSTSSEKTELLGISVYEGELLDSLIDLASQSMVPTTNSGINLCDLFSRLMLKAEHYVYCLAKLDIVRLADSSQSIFTRVSSTRKAQMKPEKLSNENLSLTERSRLCALKTLLTALTADVHRLQTTSFVAIQDTQFGLSNKDSANPLSLAVSRLKTTAKRRFSISNRGIANVAKTPLHSDSSVSERNRDLVFPLNSHLLACASAETRYQRDDLIHSRLGNRQRTISTSSSIYLSDDSSEDEDEGVHDVDMKVIPLSDDENSTEGEVRSKNNYLTDSETTGLREQNSVCAFEAMAALTNLFAVGNNRLKVAANKNAVLHHSPLMPVPSVTAVMNTCFQCLSVFPDSASIQRQVMLCLIEMASLFPVVLCCNLVKLVQWARGGSKHSMFLRLDDVHNLSLLGRLISVAVPALLQVSKRRADAALRVLTIFVRGFPDLPPQLPRRALALYSGLLRGLSQVSAPVQFFACLESQATNTPATVGRKVTKQTALQGWLWTVTLIFLNTKWPSKEAGDLVPPLLIDLFNQFDLPLQLASWKQCLEAFLHLLSNSDCTINNSADGSRSKRPNLIASEATQKSTHDCSLLLKFISPDEPEDDTPSFASSGSRKRRLNEIEQGRACLWPLLSQTSGLFSALLESPGHQRRLQEAMRRHADSIIQEAFGCIVKIIIQLLLVCSSSNATTNHEETHARNTVAQNLQSILVKVNNIIPNEVFLNSVTRLMSLQQSRLTEKALELLINKLTHLTAKFPPATILLTDSNREFSKQEVHMTETVKQGLMGLLEQLSGNLLQSRLFSADKTQARLIQLRLSCLRELAKLFSNSNPNEMLKILDAFVSSPPSCWWPSSTDDTNSIKASRVAVSAAEARSMTCLFIFECLARLPTHLVSIYVDIATSHTRAQGALRFALNHSITACRLADGPDGADKQFTVGKVHSREQHLQAGTTLLLGAFEFCTKQTAANNNNPTESLIQRLRDDNENKGSNSLKELDSAILAFLFQSTHLDLVAATRAKMDRPTSALKQSSAIIQRLRNQFISLSDSFNLLTLAYNLLKSASPTSDSNLISGALDFISKHTDYVRSTLTVSEVDMDSDNPGEGPLNTIETTFTSDPMLVWRLLRIALEFHPASMVAKDSTNVTKAAGLAAASLLAGVSSDHRLELLSHCLQWTVDKKSAVPEVMTRIQSLFVVIERLSTKISPKYFISLVKSASLINLFVSCLSLLSGEHKSRNVRHFASALKLPHLLDCFSCEITQFKDKATSCLQATLAAIAAWLRAEARLSACLDTAGTDSVLALPQALIQCLNAPSLNLTEADFVPCVDAFLTAIGGDEALLRPFGSALCGLVTRGSHWRTRLAALRLLKQTFDTLLQNAANDGCMNGDLGLAACIVSDTLVALSEALEDDRPEVEAAANRLFADLESAGATANHKE